MSFAQQGGGGQQGGRGPARIFDDFNNGPSNQSGSAPVGAKPQAGDDGWNLLSQRCLQTLTRISTETSQVKRMISKVGSQEDSLEFRGRM